MFFVAILCGLYFFCALLNWFYFCAMGCSFEKDDKGYYAYSFLVWFPIVNMLFATYLSIKNICIWIFDLFKNFDFKKMKKDLKYLWNFIKGDYED